MCRVQSHASRFKDLVGSEINTETMEQTVTTAVGWVLQANTCLTSQPQGTRASGCRVGCLGQQPHPFSAPDIG